MGSATRIGIVLSAIGVAAAIAAWTLSEIRSRGSFAPRAGAVATELPAPDWIARSAVIDRRADERREGLTLHHRVLRMRGVESPGSAAASRGSVLVYTDAEELERRVNDVLSGDVPVDRGTEATFALGRLAVCTLVHVDAKGRIADVEEVRVSFVAFSIP